VVAYSRDIDTRHIGLFCGAVGRFLRINRAVSLSARCHETLTRDCNVEEEAEDERPRWPLACVGAWVGVVRW